MRQHRKLLWVDAWKEHIMQQMGFHPITFLLFCVDENDHKVSGYDIDSLMPDDKRALFELLGEEKIYFQES